MKSSRYVCKYFRAVAKSLLFHSYLWQVWTSYANKSYQHRTIAACTLWFTEQVTFGKTKALKKISLHDKPQVMIKGNLDARSKVHKSKLFILLSQQTIHRIKQPIVLLALAGNIINFVLNWLRVGGYLQIITEATPSLGMLQCNHT